MKLFSILSIFAGLFSCGQPAYTNLDIDAFQQKIAEPGTVLLDIRTAEEYAGGHLAGAANIDWYSSDFLSKVEEAFSKEQPLAIYCRSGRRSAAAAEKLTEAGYTVFNMLGGILAWEKAEKPLAQ